VYGTCFTTETIIQNIYVCSAKCITYAVPLCQDVEPVWRQFVYRATGQYIPVQCIRGRSKAVMDTSSLTLMPVMSKILKAISIHTDKNLQITSYGIKHVRLQLLIIATRY